MVIMLKAAVAPKSPCRLDYEAPLRHRRRLAGLPESAEAKHGSRSYRHNGEATTMRSANGLEDDLVERRCRGMAKAGDCGSPVPAATSAYSEAELAVPQAA